MIYYVAAQITNKQMSDLAETGLFTFQSKTLPDLKDLEPKDHNTHKYFIRGEFTTLGWEQLHQSLSYRAFRISSLFH
jgi:hypothetical protein